MQPRRSYSLYITLLCSLIFCVLTVLIFLMLSAGPRMTALVRQNAQDRVSETVRQSAQGFTRYTDSLQSTLQHGLSLLPGEFLPEDAAWQGRILSLKESILECTGMAVFGAEGQCFYATQGKLVRQTGDVVNTAWFQDALRREGQVAIFTPPHVQALFEGQYDYVITLARAFHYRQKGESRLGVMLMDIRHDALHRYLSGVTLGQTGYAYLLGPDDRIISHPKLSQIDLGLMTEDLRPATEAVIGLTAAKLDGREALLMITSLNRTRWRLVGVAFMNELLEMQTALRAIFGVAILSSAVLSVGLALVLAQLMTRQLNTLKTAIVRVKEGDLSQKLSATGFTELALIADSFNDMQTQLKTLMAQMVEEQEKKRLYELNALQAQINPHFLYNTLDSIIWMAERGKTRETIDMVSALARLFRISISKGRTEITVREELEHVRNYLIIQKMRFQEKFTYDIAADEAVMGLKTLKLILQPMVENALNHAMDETLMEQMHIFVGAALKEDTLVFTITDDGVGIPGDKLSGLMTQPPGKSGIGIRNVHERIQLTYGKAYGLSIASREDEGTTVTIRIPAKEERP